MEGHVKSGFLVAADVSGYTEFLTGSELEHGHAIVQEVMTCLTRVLGASLRIVKYEGDAILCYAEDGRVQDPNLLLDLLDEGYLAFSDHLFNIEKGSTCTCRACKNAPSLRMTWATMAVSIRRERNARGRGGNGAMFHCNHGEFVSIAEMVDWKPFRYFTQHYVHRFPAEASWWKRPFGPPSFLMTWETEILPEGNTRIRQLAELTDKNPLKRLLFNRARKEWKAACQGDLERLDEVLRKKDDVFHRRARHQDARSERGAANRRTAPTGTAERRQ